MDKRALCAVFATAVLVASTVIGAEQATDKKTEAAPAKAPEKVAAKPAEKAPAADAPKAVHPMETRYEDDTNPFIASNFDQYSFGYKQLAIHRFMAFVKTQRNKPPLPFGRKRTGDAEVDAARDRLKEDLDEAVHHSDYALRRIISPRTPGLRENKKMPTKLVFEKVRPILLDYSKKITKDLKILQDYVKKVVGEKKEEHKPDQLVKKVQKKGKGPVNFEKLACGLLGRTYHPLLWVTWNKFDGTAMYYINNGGHYISHKPLVVEEENGDLLTSMKIHHIRRYVRDDYAVMDVRFGKGGEIVAARVLVKMEGKDKFDTELVTAAKSEDIVVDVNEKLKNHMASFRAQGGRKNFSDVIKLNMNALAKSVKR